MEFRSIAGTASLEKGEGEAVLMVVVYARGKVAQLPKAQRGERETHIEA